MTARTTCRREALIAPPWDAEPGGDLVLRQEDSLTGDTAILSRDGRWRYSLTRMLAAMLAGFRPSRILVVCALNPSTADAFTADPTIRRLIGFTRSWDCSSVLVVNAYAWRDTKPANMWAAARAGENIIGHHNNDAIRWALEQARDSGGYALAAWGTNAKAERAEELRQLARSVNVRWHCLGHNAGGSPLHPLYAEASLRPVLWEPEEPDVWIDVHRDPRPEVNVNIDRIEVQADDPDRFAQGLVEAFHNDSRCRCPDGANGNHLAMCPSPRLRGP